jgi:hypothetical protein
MLTDPLARHGAIARQEFGVKSAREQDEETRIAIEQHAQVPGKAIPRVDGPFHDGTAFRQLMSVLARLNMVEDVSEIDPDPLPGVYYGNAGIKFVGIAPTKSNGGATVIGTGGSVTLNDATDNSGRITLVTGTGVSAAGVICTITFNRPKQNANYGIILSAADSNAATAAGRSVYADFGAYNTTDWQFATQAILASSTSYHWNYSLDERTSL